MRASGILMHVSSLPSPYGIGTLGETAYQFVDFLKKSGQTYWQMLPVGPTSYGDSPYQSFSAFAGNPYFIDLDILCKEGYLKKKECEAVNWGKEETRVDYAMLYQKRYPLLKKAQKRLFQNELPKYAKFCEKEKDWLEDYALFMALKESQNGVSWQEWPDEWKMREPKALEKAKSTYREEIEFYKMLQFFFFEQWSDLKLYANENGIQLIGDMPIYVALDSADVWANPKQFYLDENLQPIEVAGCPPDAFSEDGQLWGNPLFRWNVMKKEDFAWWCKRVEAMRRLFDVIRIDHFRGFESYYAIPYGDETAKNGEWRKGPGIKLFQTMEKKMGKLPLIAEDLGFLTDSVRKMLKRSGYPGMKVLQFAFDSREENDYQPHTYPVNCVVYTGTHDNDTILGWFETAPKASVKFAKKYLRLTKKEGYHWGMMKAAWASVADTAIVTMQDLIGLGSEARMNEPSTLGKNWMWRAKESDFTEKLAKKIRKNTKLYGRIPQDK
ncbi:MAG: 4-alpha-glucanotransferase [Lachnospiraceae bacterium]